MTSRPLHVRLEVMADATDERLCGDDCPYVQTPQSPMGACLCEAFGGDLLPGPRGASLFRSEDCLAATKEEALNDSVITTAVLWRIDRPHVPSRGTPGSRATTALAEAVDALRSAEQKETKR